MKKLSKKSLLLFAGLMAVCAVAAPMSSASSWGVVGSTHILDSTNLAFLAHINVTTTATSGCGTSLFDVDVTNATNLKVTSASFINCTSSGATGHCTVTTTPTGLPWTAMAATTGTVQITGVVLDLTFENLPGDATCGAVGAKGTLTGTLGGGTGGGVWSAAAHHVTFTNSGALAFHFPLLSGSFPTTVTGTIRDTSQSLTLT